MSRRRRDFNAEGEEFGRQFADGIVAQVYGKELLPGGEDSVFALLLCELKKRGEEMIAGGVSRKHALRWAQAARLGAAHRFQQVRDASAAMVASGEPGMQ